MAKRFNVINLVWIGWSIRLQELEIGDTKMKTKKVTYFFVQLESIN